MNVLSGLVRDALMRDLTGNHNLQIRNASLAEVGYSLNFRRGSRVISDLFENVRYISKALSDRLGIHKSPRRNYM
jgi:hypothetical protein